MKKAFDLCVVSSLPLLAIVDYMVWYFCGRFKPILSMGVPCLIYPLVIVYIVFLLVRVFILLPRKVSNISYIWKIRVITIVLIVLTFFLWPPGFKPFLYGFRSRVINQIEINFLQQWLDTLPEEAFTGEPIQLYDKSNISKRNWPSSINWQDSIKRLAPHKIILIKEEDNIRQIRCIWLGFNTGWGFAVSSPSIQTPQSSEMEHILSCTPALFFWHDL